MFLILRSDAYQNRAYTIQAKSKDSVPFTKGGDNTLTQNKKEKDAFSYTMIEEMLKAKFLPTVVNKRVNNEYKVSQRNSGSRNI